MKTEYKKKLESSKKSWKSCLVNKKPWKDLDINLINKISKGSAGVYQIAFENDLKRIIGTDKEGILVIGESKNLRHRLNDFFKACCGKFKHSEGERFFDNYLDFALLKNRKGLNKMAEKEDFDKISGLYFRYYITGKNESGKRKATKLEKKLLDHYSTIFGELPPLNNQSGKTEKRKKEA